VPPSHIFGLLGPSGAGKSTVFNLLALLTQRDTGELCINGVQVQS